MIENIEKYIALAVPYSIFISSCYLFGFWGTFSIDFYSYISVTELAIFSIFPLYSIGIMSGAGFFTGSILSQHSERNSLDNHKFKYGYLYFLVSIFFTIFLLYKINSLVWILIPSLILVLLLYITRRKPEFDIITKNRFIFFTFICMPLLIFFYGKFNSTRIINGESFIYINNDVKNENRTDKRYIGKISNYIFLYEKSTDSVIIEDLDNMTPLKLHRHLDLKLTDSKKN